MPRKGENIRKRKDGRWEGRFKRGVKADGAIDYRSVYGKSYKEVKEKLILAKSSDKLGLSTASKERKFSEVLYLWEETNQIRLKGGTEYRYDYLIRAHIPLISGLMILSLIPALRQLIIGLKTMISKHRKATFSPLILIVRRRKTLLKAGAVQLK